MEANPLASVYGKIYGPLYFSTLMSTGLYGVTCMQTFFYFVHYPNDSRRMKSFVAVLWALDTIHEALTVAGVYKYIVAGLVNPLAILNENPELAILSETILAVPVQAFFVHRIYIFSGKNIVVPILWVIQAIWQIVASILYVAKAFYSVDGSVQVLGSNVLDDNFFSSIATSCLALAAAVDVLIAIAMTYLLFQKRSTNGFAGTAHILQRLTMFAVNTGIWTAVFAVLAVILMRAMPSTLLHTLFGISLSSLYCNTLLANLNARTYIRGEATTGNGGADVVMMSLPLSDNPTAEKGSGEAKFISPTPQRVRKTTEVVTFADVDRSIRSENSVRTGWY